MANGLIDYCVCIEMVCFAIAHAYTFSYTEYLPSTVEEAMSAYENVATSDENGGAPYRPPETLPRPMRFQDAFWSSTLPSETIQDIRRLPGGVDRVVNQVSDPGSISLRAMAGSSEDSNDV